MTDLRAVQAADVYKDGTFAAILGRREGGIDFTYEPLYRGQPVATTLPLGETRFTPAGSVPPFFAGLLPEGRRFSSLQRSLKASADDELTLLLAVGADTIGNVIVVPHGESVEVAAPVLEVHSSFDDLRFADLLADAGIVDAVGLPGVQDKVSARVISLPVDHDSSDYILKLNPPEYPWVVQNEAYFLGRARLAGLPTADATVVHDAEGTAGLLVSRFDRRTPPDGTDEHAGRIACEDGCQVMNRWPGDKYSVTSEALTLAVAAQCKAPIVAARDVFRQLCFAWLTGNGDAHAKNISILHRGDEWRIAPAYDLPSTLFYGDLSMALSIDGSTTGISRRKWLAFADAVGVRPKAAEHIIADLLTSTDSIRDELLAGALPFDAQTTRTVVANLRNRRSLIAG